MPTVPNPPTGEIGKVTPGATVTGFGTQTWTGLGALSAREKVPELVWPKSNVAYDAMLSDAQVSGLYYSTVMPLAEYRFWIDDNGADAAMVQALADDIGLPIGEPDTDDTPVRLAGRFDFMEHMQEALLAPIFGHYYFEVVGEVEDDGSLWHLRKLSPRAPQTLEQITAGDDGGLRWIKQYGARFSQSPSGVLMAGEYGRIPVERLVGYVWWPDATRRWLGRSILRAIYRNWLCKDLLIRVDVTNHERAGGVPVTRTDETWQGGDMTKLAAVAQDFSVTEHGGAAMPPGTWIELLRAGGTDVIASARYHDEQIATQWQQQVRMLGQTQNGSRALGNTMQDMEAMFRRSVARWFLGTFNRHAIGKWWAFNVDENATVVPQVRFTPPAIETDQPAASGVAVPATPPVAASRPRTHAVAAALPDRPLRRQPTATEVTAAADYAAIDHLYDQALDTVDSRFLEQWLPASIGSLEDAVRLTKRGTPRQRLTRADMSRIRADVIDASDLIDHMTDAAVEGARHAVAELAEQGVTIAGPDVAALRALVTDQAQAVMQMLSDGITLGASRRAVQLTPGRSIDEVATGVGDYLRGQTHRWPRDQLAGAVQQSVNAGRFAAFTSVGESKVTIYASEILDARACAPCIANDGKQYATYAEALRDYGAGGLVSCEGGPRCRGIIVGIAVS